MSSTFPHLLFSKAFHKFYAQDPTACVWGHQNLVLGFNFVFRGVFCPQIFANRGQMGLCKFF